MSRHRNPQSLCNNVMNALPKAATAKLFLSALDKGVNHISKLRVVGIDIDLHQIF